MADIPNPFRHWRFVRRLTQVAQLIYYQLWLEKEVRKRKFHQWLFSGPPGIIR